jgi:hypothetical protein
VSHTFTEDNSHAAFLSRSDEERKLTDTFEDSFFYAPDWLASASETLYDQDKVRHIYSRDSEGRLSGAAHFVVIRTSLLKHLRPRVLTIPGCRSVVSPEHIDLAITDNAAETWLDFFVDYFRGKKRDFDFVLLEAIDNTARFFPKLFDRLKENGFHIFRQQMDSCPYLELPASFDDLLSGLSANRRKIIRRTIRRIEGKAGLIDHTAIGNLEDAFVVAARLHTISREEKGQLGSFRRPGYREFHLNLAQRLLARGKLVFKFLNIDDFPVAFRYGFIDHDIYYDYQTGYDPAFSGSRPGSLIISFLIQEMIEARIRRFDFLRGDEDYKLHWTKLARDTYRYYIFPPEKKNSLYRLALQAYLKLR